MPHTKPITLLLLSPSGWLNLRTFDFPTHHTLFPSADPLLMQSVTLQEFITNISKSSDFQLGSGIMARLNLTRIPRYLSNL